MTSTTSADEIAEALGVDKITPGAKDAPASYNVAPTDQILVVAEHKDGRVLETMRWGLVPFFSKDITKSARMINARAEAVTEKPAYRHAFKKRRCLIPFDGYYEWQKLDKVKQPWYFKAKDEVPLAFAGLWEVWHDPQKRNEETLVSCTIITAAANKEVESIHDRMPLTLTEDQWDTWLQTEQVEPAEAAALLESPPPGLLNMYRVTTAVNSVRNNHEGLILPDDGPNSA